jgi:UDP-N-acetylglucosamine 4,6-dehydratase
MNFSKKRVLITGGTGTVGTALLKRLLESGEDIGRLVILSNSEQELFEHMNLFPADQYPTDFVMADIRDRDRLMQVCRGINIIVHCAAMKHVPLSESNPIECAKTNILGVQNIIDASISNSVEKVVALSSDKAVAPINTYGASKLFLERLIVGADSLSETQFSVVRYANVFGSKGSVIPTFLRQRDTGVITITDPEMTRFSITMDEGIDLINYAVEKGKGGEIIVPISPSYRIMDVAEAVAPNAEKQIVGARPGEKLHEILVGMHEIARTARLDDKYIIFSEYGKWTVQDHCFEGDAEMSKLENDYESSNNDRWLTVAEIEKML